MFQSAIFKIY